MITQQELKERVKELEILLAAKEAEIEELKPKPTITSKYRNIYPIPMGGNNYSTREEVDTVADVDRIAVLRVDCIELSGVKTYKVTVES